MSILILMIWIFICTLILSEKTIIKLNRRQMVKSLSCVIQNLTNKCIHLRCSRTIYGIYESSWTLLTFWLKMYAKNHELLVHQIVCLCWELVLSLSLSPLYILSVLFRLGKGREIRNFDLIWCLPYRHVLRTLRKEVFITWSN